MASGKINKVQRPQLVVESKVASGLPKSIPTNESQFIDIKSVAKSGYTCLGLVQWSGSGTSWFQWGDMYLVDSNTFRIYLYNNTGSAHTLNSFTARLLYWKIN